MKKSIIGAIAVLQYQYSIGFVSSSIPGHCKAGSVLQEVLTKVLKAAVLGVLGLTLMGSSVAFCSDLEDLQFLQDPERLHFLTEFPTAPQWAKDGSLIVFSHPPAGVFMAQADGSRMWALPPGASMGTGYYPGNLSPALSLDGSRVAYAMIVMENHTTEIVTSAPDGTGLRKLTSNKAIDAYPAWSPDGSRIAFYSDRDTGFQLHLYLMDADGSNERGLVSSLFVSGRHPPVWSPDGSRIAFVVRQHGRLTVYTVRPDGSDVTELGDAASAPAWSPDGSRLAFIREKEGRLPRRLYAMDPDGGNERVLLSLSSDRFWYNSLSWSPDGSEILVGGSRGDSTVPVFVVGAEGSGRRALASVGALGEAAWSPDGSRIVFHAISQAAIANSNVVLHTTARDGSDVRVLVRGDATRLVAEHSDWRDISDDVAACANGDVVSNPGQNAGLVQDCETLLRVRDQLAGDAVLNWSAAVKISEWKGVGVGGSPLRVNHLILAGVNPRPLTGVIPPELGNLTGLEVLAFNSNRLSGRIPPELGNLANLEELHLTRNHLEGAIPVELGRLTRLETLHLSYNRLAGSIPPELGNLSNLEELWFRGNRLTGTIPSELGTLENLSVLKIGSNSLTGCVPAALSGRLRSLGTDGLEYCEQ